MTQITKCLLAAGGGRCWPKKDANRASGLRATTVGLPPIAAAEMTLFRNELWLTTMTEVVWENRTGR